MKPLIEYLGKNWMLALLLLALICFLGCMTMLKICNGIVSKVEYPAHSDELYSTSNGENYILRYTETGELEIISSNLYWQFSYVQTVILEMDTVKIKYKDGKEKILNVSTGKIDYGGTVL